MYIIISIILVYTAPLLIEIIHTDIEIIEIRTYIYVHNIFKFSAKNDFQQDRKYIRWHAYLRTTSSSCTGPLGILWRTTG